MLVTSWNARQIAPAAGAVFALLAGCGESEVASSTREGAEAVVVEPTLERAWEHRAGGRADEAVEELRRLAEHRESQLGEKHRETLIARRELGSLLREVLLIRESRVVLEGVVQTSFEALGDEDVDGLRAAVAYSFTLADDRSAGIAAMLAAGVVQSEPEVPELTPEDVFLGRLAIGGSFVGQRRFDDAAQELETLQDDLLVRMEPSARLVLDCKRVLASAYLNEGRHHEAHELLHDVISSARDPLLRARASYDLAASALRQRRFTEASLLFEESASRYREAGARLPVLWCERDGAKASLQGGDAVAALPILERVTTELVLVVGHRDPLTIDASFSLAVAYDELGRPDDALAAARASLNAIPKHVPQYVELERLIGGIERRR